MLDFSLSSQNISTIYKLSLDFSVSNSGIQQILNGLPNYNEYFDKVKKELTGGALRLAVLRKTLFYFM